jgi:GTP cyclohydrolase I
VTAGGDFVHGLREWLRTHDLDPDSEDLAGTPGRVLRMYEEFTSGYALDPKDVLARNFDIHRSNEPIIVTDVDFVSTCAHHLLPFHGQAMIAYAPSPGAPVVGLSKLPRLLDIYARRLQTQETLTRQVTDALDLHLDIAGAACVIKATHGCLAHRGAHKPGTVMTTASYTGIYLADASARADLHRLADM